MSRENVDKIYLNLKILQGKLLFYWLTLILSFHLKR